MIAYYSFNGHTKVYAEALANLTGETLYEIKEKEHRAGKLGMARGIFESIFNVPVEIEEIPDLQLGRGIFVCSPVWVGGISPAVKTFLKKTDFKKRKVNMILTCTELLKMNSFKQKANRQMITYKCAPGFVHAFICDSKETPEVSVVKKHLKKLVLNVDQSF